MKPLDYTRLRDIMEREDSEGNRIPFSISYACLNGAVIDIKEQCMVCIGVPDLRHRRHTIKSLASGDIRTIHDSLVLRVNDSKIVIR